MPFSRFVAVFYPTVNAHYLLSLDNVGKAAVFVYLADSSCDMAVFRKCIPQNIAGHTKVFAFTRGQMLKHNPVCIPAVKIISVYNHKFFVYDTLAGEHGLCGPPGLCPPG